MFVASGFNVPTFTADSAFGGGSIYVSNMVAQNVTLAVSG